MIDSRYKQLAYSNAILAEVDYPVRGLIKDRNGKLVYNTPEFDLNIIHKEVKNFDSTRPVSVFKNAGGASVTVQGIKSTKNILL